MAHATATPTSILGVVKAMTSEERNISIANLTKQDTLVVAIDWGNVLYRICYGATTVALNDLGIKDFALSSGPQKKAVNKMERGGFTKEEFIEELKRLSEKEPKPNDDEIIKAFNKLFDPKANPEVGYLYERLIYLQDLKERMKTAGINFKLVLLSNTNAIHAEDINKQGRDQSVSDYISIGASESVIFDRLFTSFELGARKGDEHSTDNIFARVFVCLGFLPEKFHLIDDSESYCKSCDVACQALGVIGGGTKMETYGLEGFISAVEATLPETRRVSDSDSALGAYVEKIKADTEKKFRSLVGDEGKLTGFTGQVEGGTPTGATAKPSSRTFEAAGAAAEAEAGAAEAAVTVST